MRLSGSNTMRVMRVLDTLLRHFERALYSELRPADFSSLQHRPHSKSQVQLHIFRPNSKTRPQIHTLKSSPTTSTSKKNGSTQQGISPERGSNNGTGPDSDSTERKTVEKEVSKPSRSAYINPNSRRATCALNSVLILGSLIHKDHANHQPEDPCRLPCPGLPGIDCASASP